MINKRNLYLNISQWNKIHTKEILKKQSARRHYKQKAIIIVANFSKATMASISSCWGNINVNLESDTKKTSFKIEVK